VDLFEPSSGSQVHDFNGGILAWGLFWTLPADDGVHFSRHGRRAVLDVENVNVIDSFQFGSGSGTPGTVTMHVEWRATGPTVERHAQRGFGRKGSLLLIDHRWTTRRDCDERDALCRARSSERRQRGKHSAQNPRC
jgi:hypothetical protein